MATKSKTYAAKAEPIAKDMEKLYLGEEAARLRMLAGAIDSALKKPDSKFERAVLAEYFEEFTKCIDRPKELGGVEKDKVEACRKRVSALLTAAIGAFPHTDGQRFPSSFDAEFKRIIRGDGGAVNFLENVLRGFSQP